MDFIAIKTPIKTEPLKNGDTPLELIIKDEINALNWMETVYSHQSFPNRYKFNIKVTYECNEYILYGTFPVEVSGENVTLCYDYSEKLVKTNIFEYTWKYKLPKEPKCGSWEQQLIGTLYTVCVKACNDLGVTENSWANSIFIRLEADSATVCALQSMEQFKLMAGEVTQSMCYRVGRLGRFEVWRNLLADNNYILISYNGKVARINIVGLCNSSAA